MIKYNLKSTQLIRWYCLIERNQLQISLDQLNKKFRQIKYITIVLALSNSALNEIKIKLVDLDEKLNVLRSTKVHYIIKYNLKSNQLIRWYCLVRHNLLQISIDQINDTFRSIKINLDQFDKITTQRHKRDNCAHPVPC